ncbi:MAG: hypothetical protein NTAFB09_19230 [Nitrosospira sp.]
MSSYTDKKNRLWVQVMLAPEAPPAHREKGVAVAILSDLVASGIGAVVKSASDRLIASDQYVIKTIVPYEPSFVISANETSAAFLLNCIILNVGPEAIPIRNVQTRLPLSFDVIATSEEYKESPVVIRVEFVESVDRTAIAARITHWKYKNFLDPSPTPFRTLRRKITIELKILDAEGSVLIATTMQVEAESEALDKVRPNDGEQLPWMKRPVKNFSGERNPAQDQAFGPANIEVSITEVAEASRFATILGTIFNNQKAAIETFVKNQVNQAFDEGEVAKAKLTSLREASTALDEYKTAYNTAVTARKTFEAAADTAAKTMAKESLTLQLATLYQKEVLARAVFDRAQLSFTPMPVIKND